MLREASIKNEMIERKVRLLCDNMKFVDKGIKAFLQENISKIQ